MLIFNKLIVILIFIFIFILYFLISNKNRYIICISLIAFLIIIFFLKKSTRIVNETFQNNKAQEVIVKSLELIGQNAANLKQDLNMSLGNYISASTALQNILQSKTETKIVVNKVIENAPGVGGWGGQCTCPNGEVYNVGDKNNCESLACEGGIYDVNQCNRKKGEWSNRKVICGKSPNTVINNAPGVGGWGGSCSCPNGDIYYVGDYKNRCKSLACEGGTSGTCKRSWGPWSNRKVVCGPKK